MARCGVEGCIEITKHHLVEAEGLPAPAEPDSSASVTKKKPPHPLHICGRQSLKGLLELAPIIGLRNTPFPAPRIGANVDAIVDPWQIGAVQKGRL